MSWCPRPCLPLSLPSAFEGERELYSSASSIGWGSAERTRIASRAGEAEGHSGIGSRRVHRSRRCARGDVSCDEGGAAGKTFEVVPAEPSSGEGRAEAVRAAGELRDRSVSLGCDDSSLSAQNHR